MSVNVRHHDLKSRSWRVSEGFRDGNDCALAPVLPLSSEKKHTSGVKYQVIAKSVQLNSLNWFVTVISTACPRRLTPASYTPARAVDIEVGASVYLIFCNR